MMSFLSPWEKDFSKFLIIVSQNYDGTIQGELNMEEVEETQIDSKTKAMMKQYGMNPNELNNRLESGKKDWIN